MPPLSVRLISISFYSFGRCFFSMFLVICRAGDIKICRSKPPDDLPLGGPFIIIRIRTIIKAQAAQSPGPMHLISLYDWLPVLSPDIDDYTGICMQRTAFLSFCKAVFSVAERSVLL